MSRKQAVSSKRPCRFPDAGPHRDAISLIERLVSRGGEFQGSRSDIIRMMSWYGPNGEDTKRYRNAFAHVREFVDTKTHKPCCVYQLHYRTSGREPMLYLVDPAGGPIGDALLISLEQLDGWLVREKQHATEIRRQVFTVEDTAQMLLNQEPPEREGYHILTRMSVAINNEGAIPETVINEFRAWVAIKLRDRVRS